MSVQNDAPYPSAKAVLAFIAVVFAFLVAVIFGWISTDREFAIIISVAWIFTGVQMRKSTPNWIFGIRVPWTLNDPVVWQEVHRVAGPLFVALGALSLLVAFVDGSIALLLAVGGVLVGTIPIVWYARRLYRARHTVEGE